MATYKYNLEERLGVKNSGDKKKASENKSAKSGSAGNAKKNYGISADDPYNLYGRLYGHTDQSKEVVGGVNKRAGTADAIESQFLGDYLYSPNAWQSNQYANAKNRTNEFMGEVGDAIHYYNTYPDEFGDELEAAKKQDANTYARAAYVNNTLAARAGDTSVLEGKKGQELRDLKGLNNLYGYDVQAPGLMKQNSAKSFEEMAEIAKNFDLQNAMLTVEDYYRMVNTPVMGDRMSAARVDPADYEKAAADIEAFTGINVRDLAPDKVESVLAEVGGMKDTVDYMQNYIRWENEKRNAEAALGNWEEDFAKNWGGLSDAADYDELSRVEKKKAPFWAKNEYSDKDYLHPNEVYPAQAIPETYSGVFDYMDDQQLRDFTYLYNQPDDGPAQAKAYLEDLAPDLLRRRAEDQVKKAEEFASQNGWTGAAAFLGARAANAANTIAGAVDVLASPFRAVGGIVDPSVLENDPNSIQYDLLRKAQAYDQANIENIANATPGMNIAGINIPSQIYSGAASGVDSLTAGLLYGPYGGAAMGANAYSSARFEGNDMLDSSMQMLFEGLTDKYSLDSKFGDAGSVVKAIAKNMLVEPTEELANMALNIGWDRLRNGSNDEIGKRFNELRAMGYDERDASVQIAAEYGREALATVISSAFSGALGGTVGGTMNAVENKTAGTNIQSHGDDAAKAVVDFATKLDLGEDMAKIAKELSAAAQKGEQLNAAKLGRLYRESMKKVDEQTQSVLEATMTRNVKGMLKANGVDDSEMAGAVSRIIADNGSASTEDYKRVATNDKALALTEGLIATYDSGVQLNEKAARIAETAAKKAQKEQQAQKQEQTEAADVATDNETDIVNDNEPVSETDEFAEELAAAEIPTDTEAVKSMIREEVQDFGEQDAESVVSAYEEGQDPVAYATEFRRAMQFGQEGRHFGTISKSDSLSHLTEQQITKAYTMGRGKRVFEAEQAAKNRKGMVKVGNVDTSAIRDVQRTLNDAQRKSIGVVTKLAKAVGFNVKFIASETDAEGNLVGKNGSWDKATRTITIDINAGKLNKNDTNYAMMQTVGHELTHFIKEFADTELFAQYQDFVIGHLSEKMQEADLDDMIDEYIERWTKEGATIDRDGALEEIIADASGDALLNMTEADIQKLAQTNPTLLQRIGEFIQKWAGRVKTLIEEAYKGQTARTPAADQMLDAVEEMSSKWAELLKNASENAKATEVRSEQKTKKNQPVEAGKMLAYGHIDQRTTDTIRNTDTQLFASEVEEAQIGFAAAAQMLLSDLDNTVSGQKFFTEDGVTGQKRMTSSFLASMKDATGWTWDKIRNSLEQFAAMQTSDALPKNTVTNREMELYLDEILTYGYTTIDGQKVAPWDEYVEAKNQYKGSSGEKALQSAYEDAIDFADYAFADTGEKYSLREYTPQQKANWSTSKRIVLYSDKAQALQFVEDALAGKNLEKKLYFGMVPDALAKRIMNEAKYSKDLTGYNVCIHAKEIRKIDKKHGNEKSEALSGQRAIVPEDYVLIPDTIEKADTIRMSDDDYYGSDVLMFEKTYNGSKTTIVGVVGSGKLDLYVQTMYASAKKRSLADAASAYAPAITSETTYGTASANSIAEKGEEVKFSMRTPVEQANTTEFRNWFKDSKIVNSDGTPKVMYHGSPNDFTAFDIKKAKASGLYGKGFYFTDSQSHGGTYGKLYEVYLSIQHPLTPGGDTVTRNQVRKFLEAVAENEDDYSIENYGTYDVNEILSSVYRKDAFAVIQDVSATAIGDLVEAVKLFNEVNGTNFDGIVVDTETVAFEPTQIKSATDNIGTFDPENPDIRYQLRNPDQISDRVLLSNVMESAATNALELDQVKRYRQHIEKLNQKQAELEKTNQDIVNARKAGRKADVAALRSKADILEKQIAREDGMLLKYEAAKPLQAVVARERAALKRKADERVKAYAAKRVETVRKQEAEKREKLNQRLAEVREKRDQKLAQLRQEKQDAVAKVREEKNESFARQKYLK